MKFLPWVLVAILALAVVGAFMFNPLAPQVGTISIGRIVDESPRAQELNRQLTERYDQLVAQFEQTEEDTTTDEGANAEEGTTSEDGTGTEQDGETPNAEEQRLAREREAYSEYLRFRQELETQFQADVDRAVEEVAKARRVRIVVDEDIVRYGGVDLSDDVIGRLQ